MGKVLLVAIFLASPLLIFAQDKAVMVQDTLMYAGNKFFEKQTIRLWYGSASDKSFAYVSYGSDAMGWAPCPAQWSKYEAVVSEVAIRKGKAWIKAKLVGYPTKILIDLEGAIDNKELK